MIVVIIKKPFAETLLLTRKFVHNARQSDGHAIVHIQSHRVAHYCRPVKVVRLRFFFIDGQLIIIIVIIILIIGVVLKIWQT